MIILQFSTQPSSWKDPWNVLGHEAFCMGKGRGRYGVLGMLILLRKILTSPILWNLCFSSFNSRTHVILLQFFNMVSFQRKRCKIYLVEIKLLVPTTRSSVHNLYFACMSSANFSPSFSNCHPINTAFAKSIPVSKTPNFMKNIILRKCIFKQRSW